MTDIDRIIAARRVLDQLTPEQREVLEPYVPKFAKISDIRNTKNYILHEVVDDSKTKSVFVGIEEGFATTILTDTLAVRSGYAQNALTLTGRRYKLVLDESESVEEAELPEPLPEPKDCKPWDYYYVLVDGYAKIAARVEPEDEDMPWRVHLGYNSHWRGDDEITIIARAIPDRDLDRGAK